MFVCQGHRVKVKVTVAGKRVCISVQTLMPWLHVK